MDLYFCSLSSGSSGNCYYIGNELHGILIDAGIPARSIRKYLTELNISVHTIMGVFVSHNHGDHIRGLEVFTRKNNIPAFTTENIWNSMLNAPVRLKISQDCKRIIPLQRRFHLAGFDIEAFPVSHDAPETIGFHICAGDKKITIATDLGHICLISAPYIKAANLLVIESNYDEAMLLGGSYPGYLKARIKSDRGHLGNHQTAAFLSGAIHEKMSHICLAHLSKNNNTPEKALTSLQEAFLKSKLSNPQIVVLNRNQPTEMIRLV